MELFTDNFNPWGFKSLIDVTEALASSAEKPIHRRLECRYLLANIVLNASRVLDDCKKYMDLLVKS